MYAQKCCRLIRLGWLVLITVALLQLAGAEAAFASDSQVLARVEVTGMVDALGLPVYAHLQDGDGKDYALVITSIQALENTGAAYLVLHNTSQKTAGSKYLIALERLAGARTNAPAYVQVLHDDGRHVIACATQEQANSLVVLGFEIEWLNDTPIIFKSPSSDAGIQSFLSTEALLAYDPLVEEMINKVQQSTIYTYCGNLTGENSVVIGGTSYEIYTRNTNNTTWIARSTQYAYEFLDSLGLPVEYHYWSGQKRNVIAVKTGSTKPDEIILVTAHLDDMPSSGRAPGADDNASGSVGVMVAAEIMKDYDFERTIRFILFTGEEQGLYGSNAYANLVASQNIVAVYNMDMIAWDDIGGPVLRLHTRTTSNPGYAGDKAIADTFIDVVNDYGMGSNLTPIIDADGITASDHSSFWNKGFSAILAIEDDVNDFCDYYHTVNDTLSTLNMSYFTNYVKASVGTVAHLSNPIPTTEGPHASFTYTVSGRTVTFQDTSTCNNCTIQSWSWDFGDTSSTSDQNPTHTYDADGTYTVNLSVTSDTSLTDSYSSDILIDTTPDYCSSSGNNYSYEWIAGVEVGPLNNTSGAAGYTDFTSQTADLTAGNTVNVNLTPGFSGSTYNEYWKIWIDFNLDGDFADSGEEVFSGSGSSSVTGSFTIPSTVAPVVTRMRVSMKYNGNPSSCETFTYGEVEDYTVNIQGGTVNPPVAAFVASVTSIQSGQSVTFTDQSTNNPTSWSWTFDGGTPGSSTDQSPTVTYNTPGTYTVSLTVSNSAGSDTETKTDYITVTEQPIEYCTSSGNSNNYEWIAGVDVGSLNNTSGASGYTDYTSQTANLTAGSSVTVYLTPGFASGSYTESWKIWIDFNHDGDFADAGEEVFSGSGSTNVTGSFTVPPSAGGVNTRMRVSMRYNNSPPSCGSFDYGEVEDYSVSIQ